MKIRPIFMANYASNFPHPHQQVQASKSRSIWKLMKTVAFKANTKYLITSKNFQKGGFFLLSQKNNFLLIKLYLIKTWKQILCFPIGNIIANSEETKNKIIITIKWMQQHKNLNLLWSIRLGNFHLKRLKPISQYNSLA